MTRRIFEPITLTPSASHVAVTLPDALLNSARANDVVELQVYSCDATLNFVGDQTETVGVTVPQVLATGWNAVLGVFDVRGFELYVYGTGTVVLVPVLLPVRR